MTAPKILKRIAIAAAAIFAAFFGALVIMTALIPDEQVREAAKAQIRAVTGLDLVLRGATTISLFPSGTVSFSDVSLGDDGAAAPAMTAERLTARLRFFPLLAGRVEIADVSLAEPHILVKIEPSGRSNWSGLIKSLTRAFDPAAPRADNDLSFSEIKIAGGEVIIRDDARNFSERLTRIDMSVAWPSISKSFAAIGNLVWRGEPLEASVSLSDFVAAIGGNNSGVKLRINGAPMKLAFDGTVSARPTFKLEGTIAADTASLRQALIWMGQTPLPGGGFGRFAIKSQVNVAGGTIGLSSANLELDENSAEGVLTYAYDGRQTIQGTLAAESLDLSPYVSAIRLITGSERAWSRSPITLEGLSGIDFDLRLSAAKITVGTAHLGRTAIATNLRNGKLTVTVGESQAFSGVIKGSLALAKSDQGSEFKAQMQFMDVDLEACISELFGNRRLEGRGNLAFAVEATGSSILALTRTMNGTASLTALKGALVGLNVEQLLRRLERRPLSSGSEFRTGRTPFEKLNVTVKIAEGTAAVEDVSIDGSAVKLALAGSASIPARDLDLKGVASLVSTSAENTTFDLPFVVQGPWDDPLLLPDPQTLMRRSGAAAPLFKQVLEGRQSSDTLRKAIQRLTGSATPAASPPADAPQPPAAQ